MRRRAVGLVIALVVIALVGGTLSLQALHIGHLSHARKTDRARSFAEILLDSGIAYAQVHSDVLRAAPPNKPMILPTDGLFPAPTKADLRLRSDKRGHIHVEAVVEFCRARATERAVLPPRPTSAATTRATRG